MCQRLLEAAQLGLHCHWGKARYILVHRLVAWNKSNICGQPTAHRGVSGCGSPPGVVTRPKDVQTAHCTGLASVGAPANTKQSAKRGSQVCVHGLYAARHAHRTIALQFLYYYVYQYWNWYSRYYFMVDLYRL